MQVVTKKENEVVLPLYARVTHYDGGKGTHGKGTIVAYNGVPRNHYLEKNFSEIARDKILKYALPLSIASSYNKEEYPYVVQWDPRPDWEHYREYPEGYKDVYGKESINLIEGKDMNQEVKEVRVQFSHDRETWKKVVEEATVEEDVYTEEEGIDTFVAVYPSEAAYNAALTRFEGMVEFKLLAE